MATTLAYLWARATCGLRGHKKRYTCALLHGPRMCGRTLCLCEPCPRGAR